MGQCSNVLLKDCSPSPIGGGRRFEVQITHSDRPSLPAEQITSVIGAAIQLPEGDVVELGKPEAGRTNRMNGAALPPLPYTSSSGDVSIEVTSDLHPRYVVTVRSLGAKVFWDGVDTVRVVLDGISALRGSCLTGLCGNWDEQQNDDIDIVDERSHWKTDLMPSRRSRRAAIDDERDLALSFTELGEGSRVLRQVSRPTESPFSSRPTAAPSGSPSTDPTANPTAVPTSNPTANPTADPTANPTANPTTDPTANPTANPTTDPTFNPTVNPSANPTGNPTAAPTSAPTQLEVTGLFTNSSTTCAESPDSAHTRLCTGSARRAAREFCAQFFAEDVYEACWGKVDPQPQYDNCLFDHCNSGPALACASYRLYEALCDVRGIRRGEFTNAVVELFTGSCFATEPPTSMPTSSEPTVNPTAAPTTSEPTATPTTSDPTASPTTSPTLAAEIGFTCYASGDPHYLTFDGYRFPWHGQCSYLLTGETSNVTGFEVHVRNSPRSASQVTYTVAVAVRLPGSGDLVELARAHAGRLNGAALPALPYVDSDGNRIERHAGGKVLITAPLTGATVAFYSTGAVRVRAIGNSTLRGNAKGLCGGFDGNASADVNHVGMHGHWRVGSAVVDPMSPTRRSRERRQQSRRQVAQCRIGIVGTERFFGNEFIEVGMSGSQAGKFGTSGPNPAGFIGRQVGAGIGMIGDNDGFGVGQVINIDYFLPGSPEETWNAAASGVDMPAVGFAWTHAYAGPSLESDTGIATMSQTSVTPDGCLEVHQVHSLAPGDKSFQTRVTMTNTGGAACPTYTDVKFARSHDPDNTVDMGGSHSTVNTVQSQYVNAANPRTVVSGQDLLGSTYQALTGQPSVIFYYSEDPAARAATYDFAIRTIAGTAVPAQAAGYTNEADEAILIMFEWGSLAPGQSHESVYRTMLAAGNVSELIETAAEDTAAAAGTAAPTPPTAAPASVAPTLSPTGTCVESTVPDGTRTCTPAERIAAAEFCQRLLDGTYAACHVAVDPMPFFDECVFDHCEDAEQSCASFQIYEDMCLDEDIDVSNSSIVMGNGTCTNPTPVFSQAMCPTSAPTLFPTTSEPTQTPSLVPTTSEPSPLPSSTPTTSEPTTTDPTPMPTPAPADPCANCSVTQRCQHTCIPCAMPQPGFVFGSGTAGPTVAPICGCTSRCVEASLSPSMSTASPTAMPTTAEPTPMPTPTPTTPEPTTAEPTPMPTPTPTTAEPTTTDPTPMPTPAPADPCANCSVTQRCQHTCIPCAMPQPGFVFGSGTAGPTVAPICGCTSRCVEASLSPSMSTASPTAMPTTAEPTPMPTPMPATSLPSPSPTAGCAAALCGRDCASLAPQGCGWSKNRDACVSGGRTTNSEMAMGTCAGSASSSAPTPSPAAGCSRFTCGRDCATDTTCGWSKNRDACVSGGRTTGSEMLMGVCSDPTSAPTASQSGPNCGALTCGLDCSRVAGCGWESGTNTCVAGARTNPLEMSMGPGCLGP